MNLRLVSCGFGLGLAALLLVGADAAGDSAPATARVDFPAGYQSRFTVLRTANKMKAGLLGVIYGNGPAAGITDLAQLPYPHGSVIVMEWARPLRDDKGELLTGPDGLWRKGEIVRVDVMRREKGYGEVYGDQRTGDWEYATYGPDGTLRKAPAEAVSCAECHQQAGAGRDFVFRGRFPKLEGAPE